MRRVCERANAAYFYFFLVRFARSSWLWIKSRKAFGGVSALEFSVCFSGEVGCADGDGVCAVCAESGAAWLFSAPLGASNALNKSNKPKDSKIKTSKI